MPATYRYEVAKSARAQCQVSACKDKGEKIDKGDLRFGSLVTIKEHDTWKWKHWGCVTPAQIANILDQIGGLEGLDIEKDLDILDGYDELPEWAQEKVKYALVNGHVHDDDWKGDPELNVRGAKGLHKRTPKKKKKVKDAEDAEAADDQDGSPQPKAKKGKAKKAVKEEVSEDEAPKKKKSASKKRKADAIDEEDEPAPKEKPKAKRGPKKSETNVKAEESPDDEPEAKLVRKRGKKNAEESTAVEPGATSNAATAKPKATRGRKPKQPKVEVAEESEEELLPKPSKSRGSKKTKMEEADDAEVEVEKPEVKKAGRGRPKMRTKAK